MSITTFRLAREQEEAKLKAAEAAKEAAEEPAACPAPAPKTAEKAPAASAKSKTTASKG